MPRDANGNYTLAAGNPVASGTVISSTWANPTMSDVAAEITNSLDRNGRGGMLVPFLNVDGTAGSPGIAWVNEPGSGFYRFTTNEMRASIGGSDTTRWINATAQPSGSRVPFEIWDGAAWRPAMYEGGVLTGVLANDTYLQSQNAANDGQVNLIKATGTDNIIIGDPNTSIAVSTDLDFYPSKLTVMANTLLTDSNQFVIGVLSVTAPSITWATGDIQSFDRPTNTFVWAVNGGNRFLVSETAVTVVNDLAVNGGSVTVTAGDNVITAYNTVWTSAGNPNHIRVGGNIAANNIFETYDVTNSKLGSRWAQNGGWTFYNNGVAALTLGATALFASGVFITSGGLTLERDTLTIKRAGGVTQFVDIVMDANGMSNNVSAASGAWNVSVNGGSTQALAVDAAQNVNILNGQLTVDAVTDQQVAMFRSNTGSNARFYMGQDGVGASVNQQMYAFNTRVIAPYGLNLEATNDALGFVRDIVKFGFDGSVAIPNGTLTVSGSIIAGNGSIFDGLTSFANDTLTIKTSFYMWAVNGFTPIIGFDGGDYLAYDRNADSYNFLINSVSQLTVAAGSVTIPNGGLTLDAGFLSLGVDSVKTIAAGSVNATTTLTKLIPESGTADDIVNVNGFTTGTLLVLALNAIGDTITVKDATGNLQMAGDFIMNDIRDRIFFVWDTAFGGWTEISRSDNG